MTYSPPPSGAPGTETIDPETGDRIVHLGPGLPVLVFPAGSPRTYAEMTPEQRGESDRLCLELLDILNEVDPA